MGRFNQWGLLKVIVAFIVCSWYLGGVGVEGAEAFRRDPGHPQWHHSAFQDVKENIKYEMRHMLHSRAQVPFHVPLEVNIVLVGFNGDGGYRYSLDARKLGEFMKSSFPTHRPACLETALPLDIEHNLYYNAIPTEYGKEVPLFEVDAASVEPTFQRVYTYLFGNDEGSYSAAEMNRPVPNAIFILNFDKVRMDPRNKEVDLETLTYARIEGLTPEQLKQQEGNYIYRYRYSGGGASQVWLSSGRFSVIDLSAGPCTYGKIETEEGSVSYRTIPRLSNILFPKGRDPVSASSTHEMFTGQLAALISTTIEHVIAPDVRFETVDLATRLLIPIIVLQNHNRYNIFEVGRNYSIDMQAIETEREKCYLVVYDDLLETLLSQDIAWFVLSLADVDQELLMEGESQVWTSNDVVIVLQHEKDSIPLSYVSETERRYAFPLLVQRHILAGLASVVGGLAAPYEKASHIHQRPVLNWLWATGCHPFGPFSNVSQISQMLRDIALRNTIYARVDAALHKIRDTSEAIQSFTSEHLKTPLGEPVKGQRKKSTAELWLDKFYKKTTNLPEPFPHELVERLEKYLDNLEEQLVDLSSLLYDHRLEDAHHNSSEIFQNTIFTQQYVQRVLITERDKMKCCSVEYEFLFSPPKHLYMVES